MGNTWLLPSFGLEIWVGIRLTIGGVTIEGNCVVCSSLRIRGFVLIAKQVNNCQKILIYVLCCFYKVLIMGLEGKEI